jgi:hypothetical protein
LLTDYHLPCMQVLTTARMKQVTWDCYGLLWIAMDCYGLLWIAFVCTRLPLIAQYCTGLHSIALDCNGLHSFSLGDHWGPLMTTLIACRDTRVQMLGSVAMQQALKLELASGSEAGEATSSLQRAGVHARAHHGAPPSSPQARRSRRSSGRACMHVHARAHHGAPPSSPQARRSRRSSGRACMSSLRSARRGLRTMR